MFRNAWPCYTRLLAVCLFVHAHCTCLLLARVYKHVPLPADVHGPALTVCLFAGACRFVVCSWQYTQQGHRVMLRIIRSSGKRL